MLSLLVQILLEQEKEQQIIDDRIERGVVYSKSREEQFKIALDRLAEEIRQEKQSNITALARQSGKSLDNFLCRILSSIRK